LLQKILAGCSPAERICNGSRTSIMSRPKWGMERATVSRKMPKEVVAKRCRVVPTRKRAVAKQG